MSTITTPSPSLAIDPLGDYVAGVHKLPEKLNLIATNQRQTIASLARAAAALRSMAALNHRHQHPDFRNTHPGIVNPVRPSE
jgi:hypothetical protein